MIADATVPCGVGDSSRDPTVRSGRRERATATEPLSHAIRRVDAAVAVDADGVPSEAIP